MSERSPEFERQLLHVYAQESWHSPAQIMGHRDALKALRDAIDRALQTGMEASSEAMTNDGEGYHVIINIRDGEGLARLQLPYYDPKASGRSLAIEWERV